ncbi:cell division protein SepF [Synechococcus sp. CCY9201]|uniref:cell division protein SepF n=1 Tax=unclassified Synechococcus TaxID=2626047 RepID=UPI002B20B92D|nr:MULTISPECIES: cell division protein SepF [unclassified Synechococcus]MEA5421854.1 cell division protein SepF [Synechococcus sp. CCY9202]MEA5474801.1 cell division protein SepF [Synechococcus sp. CCY9201]
MDLEGTLQAIDDPFWIRPIEVVVVHPGSFSEGCAALVLVREQKTILVDLSQLDEDVSQRVVDFLAGGVFALDGSSERAGDQVFLFAPESVSIQRD